MWSTRGSKTGGGNRFFSSIKRQDWVWGPPNLFIGYRGCLRRVQWPGYETDHSPAPTAEIKNEWFYISTPLMPSCRAQGQFYIFSYFIVKFHLLKMLKCTWMLQQYCSNGPILWKNSGDCCKISQCSSTVQYHQNSRRRNQKSPK